jgi:hypothetical protein
LLLVVAAVVAAAGCCSLTTSGPWEPDYSALVPYRANNVYGSSNMYWLDFRQVAVKDAIFKVGAGLSA